MLTLPFDFCCKILCLQCDHMTHMWSRIQVDRAFLSMVAIEELFHEVHCPRSERIKPRATSFLNAQASLAPTHVFSESIFSASVFSESVFSESVFSDSVSSESVFSESIFSKSLFLTQRLPSPNLFKLNVPGGLRISQAFASLFL